MLCFVDYKKSCVFVEMLSVIALLTVAGAGAHQSTDVDVVIVGAGYAGLTSARLLTQHNLSVMVLEASNATGGRTKNIDVLNGMRPDVENPHIVELGGQWIGDNESQPFAYNLIVNELGFDVFAGSYTPERNGTGPPQYNVLHASNGVHNFSSLLDGFSKLPGPVQAELTKATDALDRLAADVNLTAPWTHSRSREFDSMTFTSWINTTVKLQESRTLLNVLCTTMIAQTPDVVSFLHILFYIRAAKGLKNLIVGEQQYRVVGGTQAPTFKMAAALGPERVRLSAPVRTVVQSAAAVNVTGGTSGGTVTAVTAGGESITARHAIVTGVPLVTGRSIAFDPPLPFAKAQLFDSLAIGNSVKAMLVYEKPYWRERGFTGTIFASSPPFGQGIGGVGSSSIAMETAQITTDGTTVDAVEPLLSNCFDNTPAGGVPGVLLCFVEGETSFQMMNFMSHDQRQRVILEWVARHFGKEETPVLHLVDYNWAAQPYVRGAYSAFFPPGVWSTTGRTLREPFGSIFWAGADYAEEGNGYINGAIESAHRAVSAILAARQK